MGFSSNQTKFRMLKRVLKVALTVLFATVVLLLLLRYVFGGLRADYDKILDIENKKNALKQKATDSITDKYFDRIYSNFNSYTNKYYHSVKNEMPSEKVIKLLGPSFKVLSKIENSDSSQMVCQWNTKDSVILVTFLNNKVSSKSIH